MPPRAKGRPLDLTDKERLFVAEYLGSGNMNGKEAAEAAGYKNPLDVSRKLMQKPQVRAVIEAAIDERSKRLKLESTQVLQHLCNALFLDPLLVFKKNERGIYTIKDLEEIPDFVRRCIVDFKVKSKEFTDGDGNLTVETWVEVKFMDKNQCLQMAMKHLGLIEPDTKLNIHVGSELVEKLLGAAQRESGVIDAEFIMHQAQAAPAR